MVGTARRGTLPVFDSATVCGVKRRPGRPSKGDRAQHTVRLPVEVSEAAKRRAAAEGLRLTDYLTRVIADAHGQTAPAYCYPREQRPAA